MTRRIERVAVLGAGTMGSGIAGVCAEAGKPVQLFDVTRELADKAKGRIIAALPPDVDRDAVAARITPLALDGDLAEIAQADWICEAVIEDLATKRALFDRLEPARRDGSIVSTNTSGIPLAAIAEGQPERLRRDLLVTHFFNPVRVMKLLELVAGPDTDPEVSETLASFCRDRLHKGVVRANDTVNFIGNRIGCFWMLSGLHIAKPFLAAGLTQERIDAVMGAPFGLPSTGLYGLIDLIGLDIMDSVGKNLAANLPAGDAGRPYAALPPVEQAMRDRGQLGRKTGGGFTRVTKTADGGKLREIFDLTSETWRPAGDAGAVPADAATLLFVDDAAGRFAWALLGGTLFYAADLVPEIADDIVSVDRALRWGFNWKQGPFELLDAVGPERVIARLEAEGRPVPALLQVLRKAGAASFYRNQGSEFLGVDGQYHPVPAL